LKIVTLATTSVEGLVSCDMLHTVDYLVKPDGGRVGLVLIEGMTPALSGIGAGML
jgi:hypothetical protein